MIKQWDYAIEKRKDPYTEDELEAHYGRYGWELVSILVIDGQYWYHFKKETIN